MGTRRKDPIEQVVAATWKLRHYIEAVARQEPRYAEQMLSRSLAILGRTELINTETLEAFAQQLAIIDERRRTITLAHEAA